MENLLTFQSQQLRIVNREEFEQYRAQLQSDDKLKLIKNSKYKKNMRAHNLSNFIIQKPKQKHYKRRPGLLAPKRYLRTKKSAKKRENGKGRHPSRIKRALLHSRMQKYIQFQRTLNETEEQLNDLNIVETNGHPLNEKTTQRIDTIFKRAQVVQNVHSRRFREYCDNNVTKHLAELCQEILKSLNFFQTRAYHKNNLKARAHRRFVIGFRETQNYMNVGKIRIILIAIDCEKCPIADGLDNVIEKLKEQCHRLKIPCIFALSRRQMAYALFKRVPISCIGILDYSGADDKVNAMLLEFEEAKALYRKTITGATINERR